MLRRIDAAIYFNLEHSVLASTSEEDAGDAKPGAPMTDGAARICKRR
jgi:hypothetical protein